jgi:hypothetical protein
MTEQFDPKEHTNCETEDCCMQCDTASLGKDWYLIAINPWYKIYSNPKTNEWKQVPYKDNDERSKS